RGACALFRRQGQVLLRDEDQAERDDAVKNHEEQRKNHRKLHPSGTTFTARAQLCPSHIGAGIRFISYPFHFTLTANACKPIQAMAGTVRQAAYGVARLPPNSKVGS